MKHPHLIEGVSLFAEASYRKDHNDLVAVANAFGKDTLGINGV